MSQPQDLASLLKQGNMQDLLENLSKATIGEEQTAQNTQSPQEPAKDAKNDAKIPLELTSIEALTKRLAQDLGTNFLNDDDDDLDDLSNDAFLSEDAFRAQLLRDFTSLTEPSSVSKSHLKEIYLRVLREGATLLYDPNHAERFLKDLSPQEMSALWNLLAMSPDEAIEYFESDPVVIEALKKAPSVAQMSGGKNASLWTKLLTEGETDDELLSQANSAMTDTERVNALLRRASTPVKDALAVFEENLVQFSTHPEQILELCNKLSQDDQRVFLDIIFLEYTPEKMEQRLRQKQFREEEERAKKVESLSEVSLDMNLVSHVFKEILTHMKAYKKYPEKFEPLLQRLNKLEREALEELIKVFWDTNVKIV